MFFRDSTPGEFIDLFYKASELELSGLKFSKNAEALLGK